MVENGSNLKAVCDFKTTALAISLVFRPGNTSTGHIPQLQLRKKIKLRRVILASIQLNTAFLNRMRTVDVVNTPGAVLEKDS